MDVSVLAQLGLNENDIETYKALFALGKAKSGAIMKQSGIVSSSCYSSLSVLVEKGLVSYEVRNNIRYYQPEPLDAVIEKSREATRSLEELSRELRALRPKVVERNEVNVFEGYHGTRRAFFEHLEHISQDDTLKIIGFSARTLSQKALAGFLQEVNSLAAAKHPKRMVILLDETVEDRAEIMGMHQDKSVHYLPAAYFGPTAYNISETEVLISTWGKKPFVIRIRNAILVQSFSANFDFLVEQTNHAVPAVGARTRQAV